MATTLNIHPISSAGSSPSSDDSSVLRTPISPNLQTVTLPISSDMATATSHSSNVTSSNASGPAKRKSSRRANTAERRATHNAVERQRRETLNGRFLDLAGLLPNLSQIRRPSKSSIVNSSIAHINASRRHRLLASRELRLLKLESDALRQELNEWRDRATLPRLEEPIRSEGFAVVLSGELETLPATQEDEELHGYDGYDDPDDDLIMGSNPSAEDGDDTGLPQAFNAAPTNTLKNLNPHPFAHGLQSGDSAFSQIAPRPSLHPLMAANPSFENPAIHSLYETHPQGLDGSTLFISQQQQQQQRTHEIEKAMWNTRVYLNDPTSQLHMLQPRSFPTNSTSGNASLGAFMDVANQNYFASLQRSPPQLQPMGHVYTSPEDDASSVGSDHSGRPSSGSSGRYGSPLASPVTYDLSSPCESTADYGVSKRLSASSIQLPSVPAWCRPTEGMTGGMGMMKQNVGTLGCDGSARSYLMMV